MKKTILTTRSYSPFPICKLSSIVSKVGDKYGHQSEPCKALWRAVDTEFMVRVAYKMWTDRRITYETTISETAKRQPKTSLQDKHTSIKNDYSEYGVSSDESCRSVELELELLVHALLNETYSLFDRVINFVIEVSEANSTTVGEDDDTDRKHATVRKRILEFFESSNEVSAHILNLGKIVLWRGDRSHKSHLYAYAVEATSVELVYADSPPFVKHPDAQIITQADIANSYESLGVFLQWFCTWVEDSKLEELD